MLLRRWSPATSQIEYSVHLRVHRHSIVGCPDEIVVEARTLAVEPRADDFAPFDND